MSLAYYEELIHLLDEECAVLEDWREADTEFLSICVEGSIDFDDIDAFGDKSDQMVEKIASFDNSSAEIFTHIKEADEKSMADESFKQVVFDKGKLINNLLTEINDLDGKCKQFLADFIARNRSKLGEERKSNNAARSYFNMQNNIGINEAQFMDDKK